MPKQNRLKLARKIADSFREGTFVQFTCDPPGVVGRVTVKIIATFFLPTGAAAVLKPVVKCETVSGFELPLSEERTALGHVRLFSSSLDVHRLGTKPNSFTLTLEPRPGLPPVASTALHLFDKGEVSEAEAEVFDS